MCDVVKPRVNLHHRLRRISCSWKPPPGRGLRYFPGKKLVSTRPGKRPHDDESHDPNEKSDEHEHEDEHDIEDENGDDDDDDDDDDDGYYYLLF